MFMCFACQTGGDAITFVEKFRQVDFKEAIIEIAKSVGISYENYLANNKRSPRLAMAHKVLNKAMILYQKVAEKNPQYLDFLAKRGLDENIAKNFSLGLATQNNLISEYLVSIKDSKERELAIATALEIHLIRRDSNEANSYYDTFRSRIMFPIWDGSGHVVGFGGRTFIGHKAKYLNSQESFCFNKQNILYGLHLARPHIREKNYVILVEGYMDLVALHQHGFKNSIAVMGVAISDQMIATLKNLTSNFYLALDSDDAGYAAMERINNKCLEHEIVPKYISFSPHKDPDEFLNHEGAIALNEKISNAIAFVDMAIEKLLPTTIPEFADRKLELLQKVFMAVAPLGDKLLANERITLMAKRIGVRSEDTQIIEAYREFLKKGKKVDFPRTSIRSKIEVIDRPDNENEQEAEVFEEVLTLEEKTVEFLPLGKIEKKLLQEIVQHPECLLLPKILELIDFLDNSHVKRYVSGLRNLVYEIDDSEFFAFAMDLADKEDFPLQIKENIGYGLASQSVRNKLGIAVAEKVVLDFIQEIKMEKLNREYNVQKTLLKDVILEKDAAPIQERIKEILKQINQIKKSQRSK